MLLMQNIFTKKMKEGMPKNIDKNQSLLSQSDKNGTPIHHETIFIPYYSENKNSDLDKLTSQLTASLQENGKKMGIRSRKKLETYFAEKLDNFMEDDDMINVTSLN